MRTQGYLGINTGTVEFTQDHVGDGKKTFGGSEFPPELSQNILELALRGLTPKDTRKQMFNFCLVNKRLFNDVANIDTRFRDIETERERSSDMVNTIFKGQTIESQRAAISTIGDRLKKFQHIAVNLSESGLAPSLLSPLLEKLAESSDLRTLNLHVDPDNSTHRRILAAANFQTALVKLDDAGVKETTVNCLAPLPAVQSCLKDIASALKNSPDTFNFARATLDFTGTDILSVQESAMSTSSMYQLKKIIETNRIEELILKQCSVGDTCLEILGQAFGNNKALQSLDLSGNRIGLIGVKSLADALNNIEPGKCCLKKLDLRDNRLSPIAAESAELRVAAAKHDIKVQL